MSAATQSDEKRFGSETTFHRRAPSPLSSRAKPRDLQFRGPFLGMFGDSREICGFLCLR
jgi:hypothetical protein